MPIWALASAGVQALDSISKAQQAAGDLKVQAITDKANAKLAEDQAKRESVKVRKAGTAKTSQVQSLLSQAGVAGTSPTAQLLQDTLNENVESDIMQTLLQGKLQALDLNYRARQLKQSAHDTLLSGYSTGAAQIGAGVANYFSS